MSNLEQLYQQVILDHAQRRLGEGSLDHAHGDSHQVNPTCGDEVTLQVRLSGDKLSGLAWQGSGCSISQASLSIMSSLVEDRSLDEISKLTQAFKEMMASKGQGVDEEILDLLEDGAALEGTSKFPARIKCALLGWMALRDAVLKAQEANKNG